MEGFLVPKRRFLSGTKSLIAGFIEVYEVKSTVVAAEFFIH